MHESLTSTPTETAAPAPAIPRKKKSRRRRYIIIGSIVLVVLWIVGSVIAGKREKPVPVTTEKAATRTIVQTVSATGKVVPEVEVRISPEVAGEIIELPVNDGKVVKKGDLLMKIKPDFYRAQVEQQDASISASKATNLQQKATLTKIEAEFKRSEDLHNKRMISDQEFVTSSTAVEIAKASYESSLHDIEKAQAASTQARDQLAKTTITSPIDGMVTILNSKLGDRVVATNQFAGTDVMRVSDLSRMNAQVAVNENDVVNVKLGDQAEVTIDAYGERKFKGKVSEIANTGNTTGTGTQEEVTNFVVKVLIDANEVKLRPGFSCTTDIQTNMVKEVVAVPLQSVTIRTGDSNLSPEEIERRKQAVAAKDKGDNAADVSNEKQEKTQAREDREKIYKVVFVKKGEKAHLLKVTTGIADDSYMEIKTGVSAGDEVISGTYSAISRKLKEGAKVSYDKTAAAK